MLRDGQDVFVGSLSLRALELDKRREVGIIVKDRRIAKRFRDVFDEDWAKTDAGKNMRKAEEKEEKKEEKKEEEALEGLSALFG
jgi:phosphatidylserine/phosphatidylglycerophosphate/cardiolipin synthase-like enzyme